MKYIERHKALILTSMIMGVLILSLYNIKMITKKKQRAEILMKISNEEIAEEPLDEKPKKVTKISSKPKTHQAFNEEFEDDAEFENRIKSLTDTNQEIENDSQEEQSINEIQEIITKEGNIGFQRKIASTKNLKEQYSKYSSSSYSLKGRKLIAKLPNPVYTCNASGKVVIRIVVNSNGYVVDTKVDKRRSTSRNECLHDNAVLYAKEALFSRSAIQSQEGTITYFFHSSN